MKVDQFLHPLNTKEFCSDYWGEKIFFNTRVQNQIKELVKWDDIKALLREKEFYNITNVLLRSNSFTDFIHPKDYDEAMRGIDNGMTLQIRNLHKALDEKCNLRVMLDAFESLIVHPINSLTLFYCLPIAKETAIHKDISEIFSLQVSGKKKWWISDVKNLTEKMCFDEGEITDWNEYTLTSGNMMYLPSYLPHQVKCVDEPSLSVACVFNSLQFSGLLEHLQENLSIKEWCKKPLPLWRNHEISSATQYKIHEFLRLVINHYQRLDINHFHKEIRVILEEINRG